MPFPAATREPADGIFSPFPELMSFPGVMSRGGSLEIQFSRSNPNAVSLAVPREKAWESAARGNLSLPAPPNPAPSHHASPKCCFFPEAPQICSFPSQIAQLNGKFGCPRDGAQPPHPPSLLGCGGAAHYLGGVSCCRSAGAPRGPCRRGDRVLRESLGLSRMHRGRQPVPGMRKILRRDWCHRQFAVK